MDYNRLTKKELITLIKELENQSSDNSRDIFISNISHDVRTLLNSIYGHTQVLSKDEKLHLEHHELVDKILDASSHMIDLINEIINISKNVGESKLNLCEFDLNTLINNIYSIFESIASSKDIKIELNNEIDSTYVIKSDKNKLFYILLNIIGNAIKFTQKGKVIFNIKPSLDNGILFEIIDTGIGIDASMQKEIFNSYVRTKESQLYEGNGLGLCIANKNIRTLGSELNIDSVMGKGSTFSFVIKCETTKGTFLSFNKDVFNLKEIKSLKEGNELFILIGEKFDKEKSILESYLKSKQIQHQVFDTAKGFLEFFKNNQVDMVFLDTNLTNKNSIDIVQEIQEENRSVPIIALTASVMSEDLKGISESFSNYIIKPYSFSDIDQALIFFSGKEFEFIEPIVESEDELLLIQNETLKGKIVEYAKQGHYKKLSQIIQEVEDTHSKKLLTQYLKNYNFDEIINKIEVEMI